MNNVLKWQIEELSEMENKTNEQCVEMANRRAIRDGVGLFVWCLTTHQPLWVISVRRY